MTTDPAFTFMLMLTLGSAVGCLPPTPTASVYIDLARVPKTMHDEYAAFATNCSKCHGLSRALNAHVTDPKHWDLYVARMMRTPGSSIRPDEAPVILRFLHWYTRSYASDGAGFERGAENAAAAVDDASTASDAKTGEKP